MKKFIIFGFMMTLFASLVFTLNIVVTIKPYALIIKDIVGDRAVVHTLIKPGVNPHTFSPKVSDIKILSSADLVIMNGLNLEEFLVEKLKNMKSKVDVFQVSDLIPMKVLEKLNGKKKPINPHVWLSIELLTKYIVPGITEELCQFDENDRGYFRRNSEFLITELEKLEDKYSDILLKYSNKSVLVYHPSFYYFFKEYGIKVVSVSEGHGDEPTIRRLMKIIKSVEKNDIVAIFGEKQQNLEPIKLISKQTGVPFEVLDPLGCDEQNIIELFEKNFEGILKVLRK